jgi:hypothetical protein
MQPQRHLAPEFAVFHAARPPGADGPHPNANLDADGYLRMLDLLFRSARLFHRGASCTLLTDSATQVHGVRGPWRRVEVPVDHGALMLSRAQAQLQWVEQWVEQRDAVRPLVLLDSDILLAAPLHELFASDFDVALTWRANAEMPINGGLLLLNDRRPEVARRFFRRFVAVYRERYAGADASWYGDQLALRDCVGVPQAQMAQQATVDVEGCRVRLLPCASHNFSPHNSFAAIANGLPGVQVLHFKGQRKRLMRPYWDAFLRPRESRLPWAALLGRRARRRLQELARSAAAAGAGARAEDDAA